MKQGREAGPALALPGGGGVQGQDTLQGLGEAARKRVPFGGAPQRGQGGGGHAWRRGGGRPGRGRQERGDGGKGRHANGHATTATTIGRMLQEEEEKE